ncbi:MAG: hypothetical protein AAF797_15010 [Planctomycetota bacterium]
MSTPQTTLQPHASPTIDPAIDRPGRPHEGFVQRLVVQGFRPCAKLKPRRALEIAGSPWSIGCETCDRGYVDFEQVGPHLGELGAKAVRLQAGWAKCEPHPDGIYRWDWLDRIIDSAVAQGVKPWLETSYGNPGYANGGGIGLSQGIPTGTALPAWDAWVQALAERYHDRVETWEIWNEPDHNDTLTPEAYADFFIRTATIIRGVQPDACIIGLALAGPLTYAEAFLKRLANLGQGQLLNRLAFHYYPHNPDHHVDHVVNTVRELLQQYAPHAVPYQGETGAPSETTGFLAMRHHEWSERKQAVWNLRRLLAHHARGVGMNLFQLADMQYERQQGALFHGRNAKGQLSIHHDRTVAHRKASYAMAQHVFTTLDDRYPLVALEPLHKPGAAPWQQFAWTPRHADQPDLVSWWNASDAPTLTTFGLWQVSNLTPVPLADPVLLDWLSGTVFEPPVTGEPLWQRLPLADTPFALAERGSLNLQIT